MFTLNPTSGLPIYRQLMEQVRRLISSGQLRPGAVLPSVRELALEHAVNPMTISKAYGLLEAEGLLERQRGKAMLVAAQPKPRETRSERLARLQPAIEQLVTEARQLELDPDDVAQALRRAMDKREKDDA
jgi:GntR family transcriptional regulator